MFRDLVACVLWWIQCSVTWWQALSGGYNVRDMVAGVLWWIQCSVTWWQAFSGGYNVP